MSKKSVSYLVDQIFPTKEIHIIAGASGVGKTTWAFQFLDEWSQGIPVFGYKSNPCPMVYVSCDRSEQSVGITLDRVGVPHPKFVDARGVSRHGEKAFEEVLYTCRTLEPNVRLIFIEAFSLLVPQVSFKDSYRTTGQFLSELSQTLSKEDLTIIGTAHSPKQRENDQIIDPRQMVLGSVAWGGFVETIIAIRRVKPKNPEDMRRQILLLPRNAREESFDFDLDVRGRFTKVLPTTTFGTLNERLESAFGFDANITTSELIEMGRQVGVTAKRTVELWFTQAVDEGRLKRIAQGVYRRVPKQ